MNILIAEDEHNIRDVESAYLQKAGFNIIEAETGTKALSIFESSNIDLVVLDINLPEIDGITVCKRIRNRSKIPIIMVTARITDSDELIGLGCGADDYIKKPFNPSILVARVKALLKRSNGETLNNKYISIDPDKQQVKVNNKLVELTTTEFNILLTMFKSPGRVFNREDIILKAYNDFDTGDILDRTVDVHIKNIRKKLKVEASLPEFILTVIGKGYKFNDNL
ncbi:Transcriptional regulatory protein SrrA [Patescibacteria group bacterium]|nr:Transcriptional regulatory protein SrrA [Patescibacteria group bacterium]